ncbi:MAG: glycosyltransferase family 39 protein [Chloroflexi bacterium]|nr:glycosyltransferase family 39 protein [Chloroflexota bacterium]
MKFANGLLKRPIFILLITAFIIGLFIFRDYGFTWDEPLFYKYADALGYAYNPANWFSGHFDLNNSYGPSASDHKNRGPAYLLLAREPVYFIENFHVNTDDAWHLVNFLTFLFGVYFLYKICERFMQPWAAFAASTLFTFQPLLWGHAFINPKDSPFLVFLTGAVYLGFRMVDQLVESEDRSAFKTFLLILLPAFFIGIATSIRVLGPMAGLFVVIYFLTRHPTRRTILWMLLYTLLSIVVMIVTWPYLWASPLRFVQVFQFMSDNPTTLQVLFAGQSYRAYDLPLRYLPFYLVFTLTEPIWPLFIFGLVAAYLKIRNDFQKVTQALLILAWFAIPFIYDLWRRPPNFDGMRHFLFMLPPLFIFAGFAFEFIFEKINKTWINAALAVIMLAPGTYGIIQLHPYEYAYYNSFVGGTRGVFRSYETDYWLTCYKQAVEEFNQIAPRPATLYVHREAEVAAPYAASGINVLDERTNFNQIHSGDYILVNSRTNEDRSTFRDAPVVLTVGRVGVPFCVIKKIP